MASEGCVPIVAAADAVVGDDSHGVRKHGMLVRRGRVVLIALLEKSDGGFRPIGLLPTKPRLWMRTRRILAKQWEAKHKRPWLYAGKGKGANVAAWIQAATAERAAALRPSVEYAQALMDLVKAFDMVPRWLLVQEAVASGVPA